MESSKQQSSIIMESIDLYPGDFRRTATLREITNVGFRGQPGLRIAGRVVRLDLESVPNRICLDDGTAQMEITISPNLSDQNLAVLQCVTSGDILGAALDRSIRPPWTATSVYILSKSVRPMPKLDEWVQLSSRYLTHDVCLVQDKKRRAVIELRARIIRHIRQYLDARGFIEVETPLIVPQHVMAPVHDYSLQTPRRGPDGCLRTTNTDYMRRLVASGFDRVFQIGKNFRDEPLSFKNYCEFTMLTFGMAYSTYDDVMALVEGMVCSIADEVLHSRTPYFLNSEINISGPWPRLPMRDAVLRRTGIDICDCSTDEQLRAAIDRLGLSAPPNALLEEMIDVIITKHVFPNISEPTFITEFPFHFGGPAKEVPQKPGFKQRAELFVNGVEIMNMSTHQNDPKKLRSWFECLLEEKRKKGWGAQRLEESYFECMEYGSPPCASGGLGIDRLVMLFSGSSSIEEVLLFPWRADQDLQQANLRGH